MPWPSMKAVMSSFRPVRSSGCGDIFSAPLYGLAAQDGHWEEVRGERSDCRGEPSRCWWILPLQSDLSPLTSRSRRCLAMLKFCFTLRHALLQGICGLPSPRSRQETDREWSDRDQVCARSQREG